MVAPRLGAVLLVGLLGCARLTVLLDDPSRKVYVPPEAWIEGDPTTLVAVVERYATSMGWSIDEVSAARVVAHADASEAGAHERDTWTFDVKPDRITLRRRLALGGAEGATRVSGGVVCGSYSYALEGAHLERLAELVEEQRVARTASR